MSARSEMQQQLTAQLAEAWQQLSTTQRQLHNAQTLLAERDAAPLLAPARHEAPPFPAPPSAKRVHRTLVGKPCPPLEAWTELGKLPWRSCSIMCGKLGSPMAGRKGDLVKRIEPHQEILRGAWEREAMASCDCDAYVAPAAENEANVRAAMQSAVSLPPFALPMLRAVRQASQAMLRNLPLPPSLGGDHEVLRHVCDVDKQGELVWCLPARSDVRTFAGAKHVLEQKGFGAVQQLVLLGFVHILYHVDSTCFALAMMLCHPALCPCPPEALLERATAWADALEGVWAIIEEFFKNKRVVRGLLVEKPTLRGVNALLPDRNPSNWNRSSKTDWRMLVADLRCGCWLQACVSLAEAFQGPTMSYEFCLRALRVAEVTCAGVRTKLSYYNGKPTSYISIHFLRCYSVATDVRCADDADTWKSLCHMGGGVERYRYSYEQARIALDGVTASLAPPARYHLDDLACLMCLAQHLSTSVRLELQQPGSVNICNKGA